MLSKLKRALKLKVYGAQEDAAPEHQQHGSDGVIRDAASVVEQQCSSFAHRGERLKRVSPPAACVLDDPFVSDEAQPHNCAKQQQQLPARPHERLSPSSSAAASKHFAALQALQPDHACRTLSRTFTASSNDSSSMATALERTSSSKGGSSTHLLSSKDTGSKSTPFPCPAHMYTSASPRSVSQFTHQDIASPFACYSEPTGLCTASPRGNPTRMNCRPANMSPSHSTSTCASPRSNLAAQGLISDSSITEYGGHCAEGPLSNSSTDLSSESKRVKFRFAPSTNSHASSTGLLRTHRSTGDLGSSAADCGYSAAVAALEHAPGHQQPLAGNGYCRGNSASSVDLEERLLGMQDASPAPLDGSLLSRRPGADNTMLAKLCSGEGSPVGRLSSSNHSKVGRHSHHESTSGRLGASGTENGLRGRSSSSGSEHRLGSGNLPTPTELTNRSKSHTKAGRHSLHSSSARMGSFTHSNHPLDFRRLSSNSKEGSLRSSGAEHRLGGLDLGPLCNSLAQLQSSSSLHSMRRVRALRELQQHHHQHHHYHHNQHSHSRRVSVDQPRGPVSAAVQMMARSSMEQHMSRSAPRKSMGDSSHAHHHHHLHTRRAAHAEAQPSRKSLSLEGPLSSLPNFPSHHTALSLSLSSSGSLSPAHAAAARASKCAHQTVASPAISIPFP
ncbi:hypothetical protein DUNSADRAFT_12405 [Dunaliella salina]|uniref:Uncharacterized protein n=1 Tax=Dunaliella salina TaxID=3046 RepID=A0ABQ7GBB4_DUNSA|nr:hypothetical protein DUNSADRAFT_12405 [Dunaliella salina]|eukprot:KAF5831894.1 hypothetical protein DUNSADRAFT_12405 [Dunaliella salina]